MMGLSQWQPFLTFGIMYSFKERKSISRRIADPARIPVYRKLLAGYRCKLAGTIMQDRRQLAEALVYALLGYLSMDEIIVATTPEAADAGQQPGMTDGSGKHTAASVRKVRNKFEEYPDIAWKDLDNPVVRTADSIYSDRIRCWSRLKEIESGLQDRCDGAVIAEYVDLSIRLELCFEELRSLNDKGIFAGRHPFIVLKSEKDRVDELLKTDPEKYFEERKNIEMNISRYSSYLKSPKYDTEKKKKFSEFIDRYRAQLRLYKDRFASMFKSRGS